MAARTGCTCSHWHTRLPHERDSLQSYRIFQDTQTSVIFRFIRRLGYHLVFPVQHHKTGSTHLIGIYPQISVQIISCRTYRIVEINNGIPFPLPVLIDHINGASYFIVFHVSFHFRTALRTNRIEIHILLPGKQLMDLGIKHQRRFAIVAKDVDNLIGLL